MSVLKTLPLGSQQGYAKSQFGGMDVFDLIGDLAKLGQDKNGIEGILKLLDVDINDKKITSALANIGTQTLNLTSIFQNFGNTVSNAFTGLSAFFRANPWILAIGAVVGGIAIANKLTTTPKEALDNMTESFGEFENVQNEVENLNSELQKTKDSIAELQAKGNLSLVEKEELRNLREAEKSLEMQKELSEELMSAKAAKAAQSAAVAYTKNFRKEISQAATDEYLNQIASGENALLIGSLLTDKSNVSSMIAGLQRITELRNKSTDKETWDSYNETVQDTTASIWEQADALMEQKTILEESKKAIEDNGGRLTSYQQNALDNISSSLDYIYKTMSPETWKQMKINDVFSQYDTFGTKEELIDLAKQYSNLDDFIAAATETQGAFAQSLYNATDGMVTLRDVAENIFAEAGIIDTESVRQQLIDTFANIDDVSPWAKGKFNNWANSLSKEDLELVYKIMLDTDEANFDLETWKNTLEEYKAMQALDHGVDIATEQEGIQKVTSAIAANASEVGLLDDSINSLKSRYKALKDFDADKLFEQTANGIRLNTEELARLEDAYATDNLVKLNDALEVAAERYKEAATMADSMNDSDNANAYKIRAENALEEVKAIQQLIAQYEALNGAYAKAMNAASTPNASTMRDNVKSLLDNAKQLRQAGKVGTDDFQSFMELIKGDIYSDEKGNTNLMGMVKDFDALNNQIKIFDQNKKQIGVLQQSIGTFFAEGIVGANNFIAAIKQAGNLLGEEWISQEGSNLKLTNVDSTSLANALGISEELVHILMENLKDYGWNIDTEPAVQSISELQKEIDETKSLLESLGIETISIDIDGKDIEGIQAEIQKVKDYIDQINNSGLKTSNPQEYANAMNLAKLSLKQCYAQMQEINGERFDLSSVQNGYKSVAANWNEAKDAVAELNAAIDTYGEESQEVSAAQTNLTQKVKEFAEAAQAAGLSDIADIPLKIDDKDAMSSLQDFIKTANSEEIKMEFDDAINDELDEITVKVQKLNETPIKLKTDTTEIDTALDALTQLEEAITTLNSLEETSISVNAELTGDFDNIITLANVLPNIVDKSPVITATVNGLESVQQLADALEKVNSQELNISISGATIPTSDESSEETTITGTINYELGDVAIPENVVATGTINYELGSVADAGNPVATGTINYELGSVASPSSSNTGADGTAWHSGSAFANGNAFVNGMAFARGDWGTKSDGIALGGELGQELIVRDGKFFTIGDKSAEFFRYKKNDIIFNAEQTKQILKQGRITRGHRRGKAMASGTTGSAFWDGNYSGSIDEDFWEYLTNGSGNGSGSGSHSYSSSDSGDSEDEEEESEFFDWVEILIDRIERAIDHFEKQVDNIFLSWEDRSSALQEQTALIRKEIETQKQAYNVYINQANSIGLDSQYANLIQNGGLSIDEITDEELKEQIADYQEFYEKALDCQAAVDDLTISLSECYQTAFDNVITQYDQLIAVVEHNKTLLDESIAQSEARGYIVSNKYYMSKLADEEAIINKTIEKREELIKARDKALADGVMVEGSEAYMDMNAEIDACTEAIAESNTAIIELNNSIREVEWEIFDLLQDKISNVSKEAKFLIDLMSDKKLFDDKGQLSDEGLATLGLYGQNYNTYLAQADMYAKELLEIDKKIAEDPYNQDLVNRRQELLELQQDSILSAEDEKQAIIDLVSEGIDLELESLQDLIDTYKDALAAQKDLYDYQKRLAEQTKEISTLEKQLAVYKGNESEEIKAKVQQIKVSLEEAKSNLEETQYDQFINDQQKLLDELYTEYEELLNERLDNTDALIEDMINKINSSADLINETLNKMSDSVGYTISQEMKNIWNDENGTNSILTTYGDGILNATTTVNSTLNTINANLVSMINQLNILAETDISGILATGTSTNEKVEDVIDEIEKNQEEEKKENDEKNNGRGHGRGKGKGKGNGRNSIVRPSDGAILTPVSNEYSNYEWYKNIKGWGIDNNQHDIIRGSLGIDSIDVPNYTKHTTLTQNIDNVTFSMPNVTSYSEMIETMKHDKNFEKLIGAMTIDQLAGKSSLGIGKSF